MTEKFEILPTSSDASGRHIAFNYRLSELTFTETLELADTPLKDNVLHPAFARIQALLAFVLGVSYYKLRAPLTIAAPDFPLTKAERAFVLDVYENGLGEFYARNDLRRYGRLTLAVPDAPSPDNPLVNLPERTLLPIGGGKDSLVSAQLLEAAGIPFTPFAVNPKGPILTSAGALDDPPVYVKRSLDPEMIRLSNEPGFYNGHVPSTAINSMIAALCAIAFGYDQIVLSNERSASEGNIDFDGREANHQYSKSIDFERHIASILADATGGTLKYFSLLRPYSEARIAALFARSDRFDRVFSSCNRNFRLSGHDGPLWCGECPKCLFVFLIFAPVMERERLTGIFGNNPLNKLDNLGSYRDLTGLAGQKPWECVGEILEAAACLYTLTRRPEWSQDKVVSELALELVAQYGAARLEAAGKDLMTDSTEHYIPSDIARRVASHAA